MLNQDLHIHTVFSENDSSVVPEQTLDLIAFAKHANIVGISDHFEGFMPQRWDEYKKEVKKRGLYLGTEVNGHAYVDAAIEFDFDYYIYHCWGHQDKDYKYFEKLQATNKPAIVAHPYAIDTDLNKIAPESIVEVNNRYIWRYDWRKELTPFIERFRWILSSDAHQPNWLNQTIAKQVAHELGITEEIIFPVK